MGRSFGRTGCTTSDSSVQEDTLVLRNRKAKLLAGLVVAGTVLATPAIAMAQDAPVFDPAAAVPAAVDGFGLNL